ncbi:MAG: hypothetical protein P0S93_04740 [Candidatus Neptunochlamydia sp.]|nr:hypothetical protein [Candidatus Neptunochlamydia sp.]
MKYVRFVLLVCFSLLCIGTFYYTLSYFEQRKPVRTPIKVIAQTGSIKEGLKTDFLAELLDLSVDNPKHLSTEEVEEILERSPLIKKVSASYLNSETLYVDYTLRHPVFALIDIENAALDLEGYLFPLNPYFTPKKLPELYLGLKEIILFGESLQGKEMALATELYHLLKGEINRIDLSHINESSLGKKEIVVVLELPNSSARHILRLSTKRYQEELHDYQALQSTVQGGDFIIDLRVSDLAYVTQLKDDTIYQK